MGKKTRKSETSKGIHGTTSAHGKAQGMTRLLNQLNAYLKGKNVVLTMPTKDTNRRLIRINAKDVWGDLQAKQQAAQN